MRIEYGEKERAADFNYFIDHYDELYKKYGHKFIVLRNGKILGAYDSTMDAINATADTYPVGSYIVQECNGDESGYTNFISSWELVRI